MKNKFKDKIQYKLETIISSNPLSLIKIIAVVTLLVALIVAIAITIIGLADKDSFFFTFWDTLSSTINAYLPSSDDAGFNVTRILLLAFSSLFGLFFTSMLISVLSNSLEEKIEDLKKGNSLVVEKNHIVILGFIPGEYTLIKELIKSSNNKKLCIVIAGSFDKLEIEQLIKDNVVIPNNVRIICRTVEITNSTSLNCCSIETCKAVIINPTDDSKTIKAVYVLNHMLEKTGRKDVIIVATIRDKNFVLPKEFDEGRNIFFLVLTDFVAKIIAHTCTQPGLTLAYLELFNTKGSELYPIKLEKFVGKKFSDVLLNTENAVAVGVINDDGYIIAPEANYKIKKDDSLIMFCDDCSHFIYKHNDDIGLEITNKGIKKIENKDLLILGYNNSFPTILKELPKGKYKIYIAGVTGEALKHLKAEIKGYNNFKIVELKYSIDDINDLEKLVKDVERVILLNNHDKDGENADIKVMLRLTKLRDIRYRLGLNFTISIELRRAANRTLIHKNDFTDYIVRSNMFSMFLSRLIQTPELEPVYNELLSIDGCEIKLIHSYELGCIGKYDIREVRRIAYTRNMIFLGYIKHNEKDYDCNFNPPSTSCVCFENEDDFVIIKK